MKNRQKGFSLIELLIVVAIILIIAAIAIPNLLRSKMAANEASAVGSLRSLNTACVTYSTSYGGFPASLTVLGGEGSGTAPTSTSSQLIDNVLEAGVKSGYNFTFSAGKADAVGNIDYYIINANPVNPGRRACATSSPISRASSAPTRRRLRLRPARRSAKDPRRLGDFVKRAATRLPSLFPGGVQAEG